MRLEIYEWLTNHDSEIPKRPGVYVILIKVPKDSGFEVLYIGSSKNLRLRLKNHKHLKSHAFSGDKYRVYFKECDNFKEVELALIKKFAPIANVHHNG
jgi:excinuclease UvrABC nuclease subunit